MNGEIYLDNHATTRTDPRVIQAMLPWMTDQYANPGSVTHAPGRRAAAEIDRCRDRIASLLGATFDELVITSGATESINLALFGIALHPRQKRKRIVSVATEHRAALDPLARLAQNGFDVLHLPVRSDDSAQVGCLDLDQAMSAIDDQTALVNVMFGNNEIGTLQPLGVLAEHCHARGVILHTDATQAIGKVPFLAAECGADLVSFSAHKFYGPKGIGGLIVRDQASKVRLQAQIVGGGQQQNRRSGTLNSTGIAGMCAALEIAIPEIDFESERIGVLRDALWTGLQARIPGLQLNGPAWRAPREECRRLPGNLNVLFPRVDGQSLMLQTPQLAVSSGSACTSSEPHPSHVLRAIGRSEDQARASLRFGIGRFNTLQEIEQTVEWLADAHRQLLTLLP